MENEVLIIEIDQRRFGIRSTDVVEVLRAVSLSKLPGSPPTIEGVFNMRGRIVTVLDIRRMLGLSTTEIRHTEHLIVVRTDTHMLALRADRALELLTLKLDRYDAIEKDSQNSHLIEMVGKTKDGLVYVLGPSRLIADEATKAAVNALSESVATEIVT